MTTLKKFLYIDITIGGIYLLTCLFSWMAHSNDKANLTVFPMHIESRTEEYNNIMQQISMLSEGATMFRSNEDSPVSDLVRAGESAARRLRSSKANMVMVLNKILSRCNGPWRPVVAIVDSTTCADYQATKF